MMDHFKERHANHCNVTSDTEVELTNVNVNDDDRHFYLVAQAKLLFILTMKIDTLQKMAYWTVQHIGSKKVAEQHIYEVHVTSKQNPRRKVVFIENCFNDTIKAEEIFRKAKCAIIPLDVLKNFLKDKQLSFRFYIKRLPCPPKNKGDGKDDNKPANKEAKGPGPNKCAGNFAGPKGGKKTYKANNAS